MERSELEQFLDSRLAAGQMESHGAFTLGAEEALRKIAEYQLPFVGAWAVKVIQSIVASGSTSPIRVDLDATEIRFYSGTAGYTLDDLETAFYTPEPSPNRALRHLLSGLWQVGLKEHWGFQIAFPSQTETLIWDGGTMHRIHSPVARDCTCISIAPLQQTTTLAWVAGVAASGSRNAELLLALGRNCYTCPLPLTVDGRRIDSLQRSEHHGWSRETYPLAIDYAEANLPEFRLPPGTFDGISEPLDSRVSFVIGARAGDGWRRIAEKRIRNATAHESATLPFILCVNMKIVGMGKSQHWEKGLGPSTVYWVLDGALVGTEHLIAEDSYCSLGCFLSAEGLETDLSTFRLLESKDRQQRLALARQALPPALGSLDHSDFDELVKRGKLVFRLNGGAMLTIGVALLSGGAMAGAVTILGGGAFIWFAGKKEEGRLQAARTSLEELKMALQNFAP